MKRNILILVSCAYAAYAKDTPWNYNGIFIVNNSKGDLIIEWDNQQIIIPKPFTPCVTKQLIPAPVGTTIRISYADSAEDHTMPTCKGKPQLRFRTNKKIVLYEITGGFVNDIGEFNNVGSGIHCMITITGRLTASIALNKYPDLALP